MRISCVCLYLQNCCSHKLHIGTSVLQRLSWTDPKPPISALNTQWDTEQYPVLTASQIFPSKGKMKLSCEQRAGKEREVPNDFFDTCNINNPKVQVQKIYITSLFWEWKSIYGRGKIRKKMASKLYGTDMTRFSPELYSQLSSKLLLLYPKKTSKS